MLKNIYFLSIQCGLGFYQQITLWIKKLKVVLLNAVNMFTHGIIVFSRNRHLYAYLNLRKRSVVPLLLECAPDTS